MQPRVTDISHHNTVTDLNATAQAGIWGVIHKATQGSTYKDPEYVKRRPDVAAASLLWGAYHFGDSSDVKAQVSNFLAYAAMDNDTIAALDYEDHPSGKSHTMKPEQMVAWLREFEARTGRKAVLYSGNRIKEDIHILSADDADYVTEHLLWLAQYGPQPKLPKGFESSFLWQFTDGIHGPEPHTLAGVHGEVDLNAFNGSLDDLRARWTVTVSKRGLTDDPPRSTPRGEVDEDAASFNSPAIPSPGKQSIEVEVVQRELDAMGYHEVGDFDGQWGGKTAAGIKAFFIDRGLNSKAELGSTLNSEISKAKVEGFKRPIAASRANATPEQVAPRIESVRVNLWTQFWAKVGGGIAALGITGSTVDKWFSSAQSTLQPIHDAFAKIPPEVWFLICGAVAGAAWYASARAAQAATTDYNTGRLN